MGIHAAENTAKKSLLAKKNVKIEKVSTVFFRAKQGGKLRFASRRIKSKNFPKSICCRTLSQNLFF